VLKRFKPQPHKEIPFIIFASFLGTYILGRIFIFLFPGVLFIFKGNHIHHFAYGIIILTLVGLFDLIVRPSGRWLGRTAVAYGIGLALSYDEFGMWLHLRDFGVARYGFDAIIIIALILLNIIYSTDFWIRSARRLLAKFSK
jgi:hypothetical protein